MPVDEIVLPGGMTNAGLVTRVGDTVRRPWRPTSASTHALLAHLEAAGFDGAPRLLGRDEHGREVLSYIPGEAVYPPYPDWSLTDDALISVAQLLRRFHAATRDFDPSPHHWPVAVPDGFRTDAISHNDPNLDNVVFRDGRAVALIDFDLAAPGSAVWDVACAARLWAPLREATDEPEVLRGRGLQRLRLFADAYGMTTAERRRLLEALPKTHAWSYSIVRRAIEDGHETFRRRWIDGDESKARRTQAWLAAHGLECRAALEV